MILKLLLIIIILSCTQGIELCEDCETCMFYVTMPYNIHVIRDRITISQWGEGVRPGVPAILREKNTPKNFNSTSMEKLPLKIEGGGGLMSDLVKIVNLPELLM